MNIIEAFAVKNLVGWVAKMLDGDGFTKFEMWRAARSIQRNNFNVVARFGKEVGKVTNDAFNAADLRNIINKPGDIFGH
jgi:hypothetical protein